MWASVDVLTAAAAARHILPKCASTSPNKSGHGCTAFVADPDVILLGDGVTRACKYYRALEHDAVLAFAPPRGRFETLTEAFQMSVNATSTRADSSHPPGASARGGSSRAVLDLMGNRHVSFLSLRAMDALAELSRMHATSYDLDKGLDMILPNLLPAAGIDTLWLLDGCGMFISQEDVTCRPQKLQHLRASGLSAQWSCTALNVGANAATPDGVANRRGRCRLPPPQATSPPLGVWDAFIYMIPGEMASSHICANLDCLPPVRLDDDDEGLGGVGGARLNARHPSLRYPHAHSMGKHTPSTSGRGASMGMSTGRGASIARDLCERSRGLRHMPILNVTDGMALGRRTSHSGGHRVRFHSVHLQGNAKGACLSYFLAALTPALTAQAQPRHAPPTPLHARTRALARAVPTPAATSASRSVPGRASRSWYELDWHVEAEVAARATTRRDVTTASDFVFIVMTSAATSTARLPALMQTWARRSTLIAGAFANGNDSASAHDQLVAPIAPIAPMLMLMSDRDQPSTGEVTTTALRGRGSYWDAQQRHFEGLRLLYLRSQPTVSRCARAESGGVDPTAKSLPTKPLPTKPLPAWILLVDDDSYVNVDHLVAYAARLDPSLPLLIGHVLDGVWTRVRGFAGGAGMLLSRAALERFGCALASGAMPLPPRGTPNDVHIKQWSGKLGVRCVHSNGFAYAALPADARVVHTAGLQRGMTIGDYVGPNSPDGLRRRAEFAAAVGASGVLDAQMLGAVVLHRVPPALMHVVHARLELELV